MPQPITLKQLHSLKMLGLCLYTPYNRSQILQYVKYTKKIKLQKELGKNVTITVFLDTKNNNNKTKNQT